MASDNAEHRSLTERLNTGYWILLTVLLGLPLITPLLRWSSVPCTHDGHLHYHRVAAMAHAWDNGIYLTRWLPDLAFGYGYPFFVYREAAPLYAVLLPFLAGLPLPAASNLFYAATILLCGVFMFLWVRDLFGPRAGLVSAVAYMGAPYVLVDALIRGNSPESLALPLLPLILWAGRRWVLSGSVRYFLIGALGLALLSFGHNISTFIFAPTLAVYLVALAVMAGRQTTDDRRRSAVGGRLCRVALLLGLGLGLAFFYTGGAVLEMDQVTLEMSTTSRNNDWRNNFASLGEILSPVAAEDPALVNPPLLFRLGWMPLLLAAFGVTGLVWIKGSDAGAREQRLHIWLMALGVAVYLFMALPVSRWLWEIVPLIDFVQFPWRFVGRAALPVAFLAGVPFYYFDRGRQAADHSQPELESAKHEKPAVVSRWWPAVILPITLALLIIETIPNLYPRMCMEEPFPTILTVHNYERVTGLVGVDPEGSYFPRTVGERPSGSPLEADYIAGQTPQRFDQTALPAGAEVRDVVYDRYGASLNVDSPEPFTARYLSFAFPGWSARVDGEQVEIAPENPSGLITFDVPSGMHEIEVDWGLTPTRMVLVGLSALSALAVIGVAVWTKRQRESLGPEAPKGHRRKPTRGEFTLLGLAALALLGIKLYTDRTETLLRRTSGPSLGMYETLITVRSTEMRLEGVSPDEIRADAGGTFQVDMAWTAIAPPSADYQTEIWLEDSSGLVWSQKGTERPRIYEDAPPTRQWSPGEWGWDSREVRILTGTPPGTYPIVMTLFDKATLQPVTLIDDDSGEVLGPTAVIGWVSVENPLIPPTLDAQFPLQADLPGLGLRLLGYNQDRSTAAPGDSVLMTFFWNCSQPAACGRIRLSLSNGTDPIVEWKLPAVEEGMPPTAWPNDGFLRGQHLIQLPAGLASGDYQFFLNDDIPLGELAVLAPERVYVPPQMLLKLNEPFTTIGTEITLVGLAADPSCSPTSQLPCAVPLVWRAETPIPTSYHAFVHLVDEAGNILAQSDGVPAGWTRPTTGWLPGEYIVDVHTLTLPAELPPGQLTFRVGLYDPVTGARLRTNGDDASLIKLP